MDKNQTKELLLSLKLILVGIAFWIIRPRYFLFFLIKQETIFNTVVFVIIGTIIIIVALTMIHRVYPFAHTILALILSYFLLIVNILYVFLYRNEYYRAFSLYIPFIISIVLILISKILESGLRYFRNRELSRKWRYFVFIIFFGVSIPLYLFISLKIFGIISFNKIEIDTKAVLIFLPIAITILILVLYYIIILIKSFNFLSKIKNNTKSKG